MKGNNLGRRGQVAVFVIIAIVLVIGIIIFFVVRDQVGGDDVPVELAPVFDFYLSCIDSETRGAIELAMMQGGHVFVPDYIPGSEYAPFSSHLNFFGVPVPYWYYVSGNGVIKEQVPTKSQMEVQIARYVEEGLTECDFESFFESGFEVTKREPIVDVDVQDNKVLVSVSAELSTSKDESSARKVFHEVSVSSKLGRYYETALKIYNEQKGSAFLEQYATDVLYFYTPVNGVEVQCGPKIWPTQEVMSDLREGLQENIQTIKLDGGYYELQNKEREYFVWDLKVDSAVNFMYSKDWPTKIEIEGEGVDEDIMIAESIGTQEGLGIMGFCYVPYHFVYDVSFPVMIQVYDGAEIFQFPVVVIIDNNVPRKAVFSETPLVEEEEFDLCEFKEKVVQINIRDSNLNPVDGDISYECFTQRCRLGESEDGRYVGDAPACLNGFLHVRAEGFADKRELFSTNKESTIDVTMEREHDLDVEILIGGQPIDGTGIVTFVRDDGKTTTMAAPQIDKIKLSSGSYEVRVYVYGDSTITIPGTTKTECIEVPKGGLLGLFGSTKEECFSIDVPATDIEFALIGGGTLKTFLLESQLERGGLVIRADKMPTPTSLDQLQLNFELFENRRVSLEFTDG